MMKLEELQMNAEKASTSLPHSYRFIVRKRVFYKRMWPFATKFYVLMLEGPSIERLVLKSSHRAKEVCIFIQGMDNGFYISRMLQNRYKEE